MADEKEHLQHELDALLEASMGDQEEEENNNEAEEWYQNVTQRLQQIPDASDRYKPTCSAIHQLQDLIKEAIQKQPGGVRSSVNPFIAIATKQEQLFSAVVHFHRGDLERLKRELGGVEGRVVAVTPSGGYVSMEKQRLELQLTQEQLSQQEQDLHQLLEAPQPIELYQHLPGKEMEEEEEEEEKEDHTPLVYREVRELHGNGESLLLHLQSLSETLSDKIHLFESNLQQERQRFLRELSDVESWLKEAYATLRKEPNRDFLPHHSREDVQELQEEYSREGVKPESPPGTPEGAATGPSAEGVKQDKGVEVLISFRDVAMEMGQEVKMSGSSLGSDILDVNVAQEPLETSVDVELGDEEFQQQVLRQVLSESSSSPSPPPHEEEQGESPVDVFESSVDPVGQEWAEEMEEEETDRQTETASVSSESTVRGEKMAQERSPEPKRWETEFSEEGVNVEGAAPKDSQEGRRGGGEKGGGGKSLADELSELGEELEEEREEGFGGEGVKSGEAESGEEEVKSGEESVEEEVKSGEEEDEGSQEAAESDQGSEVSSAHSVGTSLHWVARLCLLPMYQLYGEDTVRVGGGRGEGEEEEEGEGEGEGESSGEGEAIEQHLCDIEGVIQSLQTYSNQLKTQSHKMKSVMANINFVINATSPAMANQLRSRLEQVKALWEPLSLHLKQRTEQLVFEKTQSDSLEYLHEAVKELEDQPETNLTQEEIEEKYWQLMEFFVDIDSFVAQKDSQVAQLEAALQPLLVSLGDGGQLLQSVVEQIREGYQAVEERLKLQKQDLEKWREEWSVFQTALSTFQNWVGLAEETVGRESYGSDVVETERYLKTVMSIKEQLTTEEEKVQQLVNLGNTLLASVGHDTPAEEQVDATLTESETRWYNLVERVEAQRSAINRVLISWRAYQAMYHGARSFISQMTKMVGREPVESSHGNTTLLPTYRTYADQVRAMQVQYDKLTAYGTELSENPAVGARESIAMEMKELKSDWERLKDNVMDSLTLLQREYDDWVCHQLQKMQALVRQVEEIVSREKSFVAEMPLETFLKTDPEAQLREADNLVACQDQLTQLEADCTSIDEVLLERQLQQGTAPEEGGGGGEGETQSSKNAEEHVRLQQTRERLQLVQEALTPAINIFFLQLQLLQKIQGGHKVIVKAMEVVGNQAQLEDMLANISFSLSDDHFEQLRSDAYDLGTVCEEYEVTVEGAEEYGLQLPPCEQLVHINRELTGEIETLSDESATAKVRLQLFIEWWVEFQSNHGDLCPWLDDAESRLSQVQARAESTQSPLVSPAELLEDVKELQGEMGEKEVVLNALTATARNIMDSFHGDGEECEGVEEKVRSVKSRWEALKSQLSVQCEQYEETSDRFSKFLTSFTGFCNWLCEMHGQLLDELCVAIPHRASEDTISVHKARLKEFSEAVSSHEAQFQELVEEGGRGGKWAEFLVPEEMQTELPSDDSQPESPVFTQSQEETDFPFEERLSQLPYFRTKMKAIATKWTGVQQLLRDRENQLEMCLGNMIVFLEGAEGFVQWVGEKMASECLSLPPPADLGQLQRYLTAISQLRVAMSEQDSVRLGLLRAAENLIGQMSGPNADKVKETVSEVEEKWRELGSAVERQVTVLEPLIGRIEVLLVRVGECEGVVEEGEGKMTECGPIGADLERLLQQQETLDALDDELLNRKRLPEEVTTEAMNIVKECREGSGEALLSRVNNLQNRFDELVETCGERREECEEATAEMQSYKTREAQFTKWLEGVEKKVTERVSTKKPIGAIHGEREDFMDFMKEVEQQTEQYSTLRNHGSKVAAQYKPSEVLDEMMSSLNHRWEDHVAQLCAYSDKLLTLSTLWEKYEAEVRELLNWITNEANRFSKEVTTVGDKGIEDHIESCKVFSDTLEGKNSSVLEIQQLAEVLREDDGEKSNGTCDVDSRLNDVNQHWDSLCKLLIETLLRLEATSAEVRHVLLIRQQEFEWLEGCEELAADQRASEGDLERLQEEIDRQQQLLTEVEGHSKESEFIQQTAEFLMEHTRKAQREEIKSKAEEFVSRYDNLRGSLGTYVGNLEKSIPVWREFNEVIKEFWEWLDHTHLQLTSEETQPGNAIVTETSLRNVEMLSEDVTAHQHILHTLSSLTSTLTKLTPHGDQEYVVRVQDQLVAQTEELVEQARDRADKLEQRLKSWQVFPVAEAQAVQAFLHEVQVEVGGGEGEGEGEGEEEEEMSSEQLLEKLERLQELQQLQLSNKDKLSTIDHSVESEEMKTALEKNPDISKERSNLLQGWSTMSLALSQRIAAMKQKAEMVKEVEGALGRAGEGVRVYREMVDMALPAPPELEEREGEIREEQAALHNQCQSDLTSLANLLDRYSSSADLAVPVRLSNRAAALDEEFQVVARQAEEKASQIQTRLEKWAELKTSLPRLSRWLRTSLSELSSLRQVANFATEFSSLESRLESLKEEVEENREPFLHLQSHSSELLLEDDISTQLLRKQFLKTEQDWQALNEGIEGLPEIMAPWKELTDRFDELADWFDQLRGQVRRDLSSLTQQEDSGADMSDHLVMLKDHLLKMTQHAPSLSQLTNQRDSVLTSGVCTTFEPAHDLSEQITELEELWAGEEVVLRDTLNEVEEKVSRWKEEAVQSIRTVRTMNEELASRDEAISDRDREIEEQKEEIRQLNERLRFMPTAPQQKPSSFLQILLLLLLLLLLLFVLLSLFFHDLGPHLSLSPILFHVSPSPYKPL